MTKSIEEILAAEAQEIEEADARGEQHRELESVRVTRGHSRSRVLQIRLNDDELERLETLAQERELPTSTVARALLLQSLNVGPGSGAVGDVEAAVAHALRTTLRPDLLTSA